MCKGTFCCTLLTRQSALVLKLGVLFGGEAFTRRLVCNVAIALVDYIQLLKCFIANALRCKAKILNKYAFLSDKFLTLLKANRSLLVSRSQTL